MGRRTRKSVLRAMEIGPCATVGMTTPGQDRLCPARRSDSANNNNNNNNHNNNNNNNNNNNDNNNNNKQTGFNC